MISQKTYWDPVITLTPNKDAIPSPNILQEPDIFLVALPLDFAIPYKHKGRVERFINDTFVVFMDGDHYTMKSNGAIDMSIYLTFCPQSTSEPLLQNNRLFLNKLRVEGRLEEVEVILGWEIDTHLHLLCCPKENADKWQAKITSMLEDKGTNLASFQ